MKQIMKSNYKLTKFKMIKFQKNLVKKNTIKIYNELNS
jgi:hypothetical protein